MNRRATSDPPTKPEPNGRRRAVDPAAIVTYVAARLARYPGEYFLSARVPDPPEPEPLESIRDACIASAIDEHLADVRNAARPPSNAELDEALRKLITSRVAVAVQNHPAGYATSDVWSVALSAGDRPEPWLALADAQHRAGRWLQAQASRAAAKWLGAPIKVADLVFDGPDPRPERVRNQRMRGFRRLAFEQRHWYAWSFKNGGLVSVPSLLAYETDENFSVRTRIYRSLGQAPHPAALRCLHEGTYDPHPFARAQAVRSLGWCGDPASVPRLGALAERDAEPEVRRSARIALWRVGSFWRRWGERGRVRASVAAGGAPPRGTEDGGDAGAPPWIPRGALQARPVSGFRYEYTAWFADARAFEARLAAAIGSLRDPPGEVARALASNAPADVIDALNIASRMKLRELCPAIAPLADARVAAVAWNARRALRRLGAVGSDIRRAVPLPLVWPAGDAASCGV